jgi:glycosyltransferase involved in cell wall biosynthesis
MRAADVPRMLVITHSDFDPSSRLRLMQYFPRFIAAGWRVDHRPSPYRPLHFVKPTLRNWEIQVNAELRRANLLREFIFAGKYDAIMIGRELPNLIGFLKTLNPRLIFDLDDAIYLGSSRTAVAQLASQAAVVVAGNRTLAKGVSEWSDSVKVIPTVVDPSAYRPAPAETNSARLRVGWVGSDYSIRETLFPHLKTLAVLQREIGFEFVIVSGPRPILPARDIQYRFVEWSPVVETEIAQLFDVGIMPLVDSSLQRAKCGAKLLQYMAAGLPVIASPIGVNRCIVTPGLNGFLAVDSEDWRLALQELAADPALRRRLGAAGRARVESDYSIERWSPVWLELLEGIARIR